MTPFIPGSKIPPQVEHEVVAYLRARGAKDPGAERTDYNRTLWVTAGGRVTWFGSNPNHTLDDDGNLLERLDDGKGRELTTDALDDFAFG